LYAQLVDRVDAGKAPGIVGYDDVYRAVRQAIDDSHAQGALKARVIADPDRFVELDGHEAETLLDQRAAGKRLMLITNSEWSYTQAMMSWCFDRDVPGGSWRELFDLVVVSAAKPRFFAEDVAAFRVVDEQRGWLAPHRGLYEFGGVYHGGSARLVEQSLGLTGDQILYVGDHLFGDVHMSKATLRWRTALILRELEAELEASVAFAPHEARLAELMAHKSIVEERLAHWRLQRVKGQVDAEAARALQRSIDTELAALRHLDEQIAPLAQAAAQLGNRRWGPLMRAGNDKSLFARQVERYADLYTSRVSNLGRRTPFAYLRAVRTSLPHDAASEALRST
jgi:5'-nucleotidase